MKRDRIIWAIKIAISVLLMILLLRRMDYLEFRHIIENVSKYGVVVFVVAYLFSIVLNAVKWHILLPDTEIGFLMGLSFRAQLYSSVLPGQVFGEASKVTAWSGRRERVSTVAASVIFDKVTGIIGQALIGIIGVYSSSIAPEIGNKWILLIFVAAAAFLLYVSSLGNASIIIRKGLAALGKVSKKVGDKCIDFYDAWCLFSHKKSILFKSVLLGMANQFIGIVAAWYLSSRMGLDISVIEYCWIMPLMSVILLLPISFAGIGLRDASLASMLSVFGVSAGNSLIISTTMLLAQAVAASIGGGYILKLNISGGGSGIHTK